MRGAYLGVTAAASLLLAASAGCSNRADDCSLNGNCGGSHPAPTSSSSGSGGGTGSSAGGSGGSGGGGGLDCAGDPTDANTVDACAVFVVKGGMGDGTKNAPLGDLGAAIRKAAKEQKRVYACGDFDAQLVVTDAFDLWGGFDCEHGWTWQEDARSQLTAPADVVPLIADVNGDAALHTFAVEAKPATAVGGSSVAVVFGRLASPSLDRCDVTAHDGNSDDTAPVAGAQGLPSVAANPSTQGALTCNSSTVIPGGTQTCDGVIIQGGNGGDGGTAAHPDGYDGGPGRVGGSPVTSGGNGDHDPNHDCSDGATLPPGKKGDDGAGGKASELIVTLERDAMMNPTGGVTFGGGTGQEGVTGAHGVPGGGGGGAHHNPGCRGGLGGAGSSGSCGGGGGSAGRPGGNSIGIVCLGPRLALDHVAISAGHGGSGSTGGAGGMPGATVVQPPFSLAGLTNPGGTPGCQGGAGSSGGAGGAGGGGRGGHALDVVFLESPVTQGPHPTYTHTHDGAWHAVGHGIGGPGGATTDAGDDGHAGPCWDFSGNEACP
ncbi:MAG TPA: hypothetical protein VHB21_07730 [Minicystis sp.]|nr:hypothetical protein [Minicystis sp.]